MITTSLCLKKPFQILQLFFIMVWASHLSGTDSLYSSYALCCIFAVICFCDNCRYQRKLSGMPLFINLTLAFCLSFASTLANYPIFEYVRKDVSGGTNAILNLIAVVGTFAGGIIVFYHIFLCAAERFPMTGRCEEQLPSGNYPNRIFFPVLISLSVIYLTYLIFVAYPGSVTSDAMWQIDQTYYGNYSVHHPYWHTMCIKVCMTIGYGLFHDVNAAAATYNGVQAVFSACCFAYAITTLYQYRIPKPWIWITYAMFALLPHHITYSGTMWKDVPFGLTMLVVVVSMFRIMRHVGNRKWLNYAVFILGGIGASVFRTNGWYALVAAFLMLLLFFRKRCKELLVPWMVVLVVGWVMTGPAMTWLNVKQNNFLEGLSVPMQQVARVIVEECELTEEETSMLEKILDLDRVLEVYWAQCCDPIKEEIRDEDPARLEYLMAHKEDYLKLWIRLGLKHPWVYVKAWVEETKGYWNGGYDYYIYSQYVHDNDYGMYMVKQDNLIHDLVKAYFTITRETIFFQPLQSIGLNIWILSFLCFLNMAWGRKEFLLTMPIVAVIFTLWLTTPVFSEFRYAYSVFTSLPFILPVSLWRGSEETE